VCPHTHTCVSSSLLLDIYADSYFYVYVLMPKKTKLPYTVIPTPIYTGEGTCVLIPNPIHIGAGMCVLIPIHVCPHPYS
jgi:hypothetical protein